MGDWVTWGWPLCLGAFVRLGYIVSLIRLFALLLLVLNSMGVDLGVRLLLLV